MDCYGLTDSNKGALAQIYKDMLSATWLIETLRDKRESEKAKEWKYHKQGCV
jgi:hypothetical protein